MTESARNSAAETPSGVADFDLDDYLPYLINRTGVALAESFARELTDAAITVPMWRVLAVLYHKGEQRQIDLSHLTSIEQSTLSRLVTSLVRKGLVSRRRSARSSREVTVDLTEAGRAMTAGIVPVALTYEAIAVDGLSRDDLATVRRCLKRMYRNLSDWLDSDPPRPKRPRRRNAAS